MMFQTEPGEPHITAGTRVVQARQTQSRSCTPGKWASNSYPRVILSDAIDAPSLAFQNTTAHFFHGVLAPNAKLRALVVPQEVPREPEPAAQQAKPAECEANCARHQPVRLSWAKLLKRVFDLDLEHCPNCGGELRIIAAILEQSVIEKILTHLGLQARAPPRAPARGQALHAA